MQLYEVVDLKEVLYLMMEFVAGGELYEMLVARGRFEEPLARSFFRQLVAAVHHCHRKGVVHRDIKLENILVDADGHLKLVDFGLAATYAPGELLETFCGSPPYAAPEMFTQTPYLGAAVDAWSVGVVLYQMLCGFTPFESNTLPRLRERILKDPVVVPVYVSAGARSLLHAILCHDTKVRYGTRDMAQHPWVDDGFPVKLWGEMIAYDELDDTSQLTTDGGGGGGAAPIASVSLQPRPAKLEQSLVYSSMVIREMEKMGFQRDEVMHAIDQDAMDHVGGTYLLLAGKMRRPSLVPQPGLPPLPPPAASAGPGPPSPHRPAFDRPKLTIEVPTRQLSMTASLTGRTVDTGGAVAGTPLRPNLSGSRTKLSVPMTPRTPVGLGRAVQRETTAMSQAAYALYRRMPSPRATGALSASLHDLVTTRIATVPVPVAVAVPGPRRVSDKSLPTGVGGSTRKRSSGSTLRRSFLSRMEASRGKRVLEAGAAQLGGVAAEKVAGTEVVGSATALSDAAAEAAAASSAQALRALEESATTGLRRYASLGHLDAGRPRTSAADPRLPLLTTAELLPRLRALSLSALPVLAETFGDAAAALSGTRAPNSQRGSAGAAATAAASRTASPTDSTTPNATPPVTRVHSDIGAEEEAGTMTPRHSLGGSGSRGKQHHGFARRRQRALLGEDVSPASHSSMGLDQHFYSIPLAVALSTDGLAAAGVPRSSSGLRSQSPPPGVAAMVRPSLQLSPRKPSSLNPAVAAAAASATPTGAGRTGKETVSPLRSSFAPSTDQVSASSASMAGPAVGQVADAEASLPAKKPPRRGLFRGAS